MTTEEAIKILQGAKVEIEWSAPLDYQEAIDMAIGVSLLLAIGLVIVFASFTSVPLEYRYIAMAILFAGGMAGMGHD